MGDLNRFIHYEVPADGGGAPAAAPDVPAVEPAAPPPVDTWAPSRDEWAEMQQTQRLVVEALSEPDEPEYQPEPNVPEFRTPQELAEYVQAQADQRAEAKLTEMLAPYLPVLDKQAADEGKALVTAELERIAKGADGQPGIGEFDTEMALTLSRALFAEGMRPDLAIRQAAQQARDYEQRIADRALEQQREQMQNRLDNGTTPAGQGATDEAPSGYPQGAPPGMDKYALAAWRWQQSRNSSGSPVG